MPRTILTFKELVQLVEDQQGRIEKLEEQLEKKEDFTLPEKVDEIDRLLKGHTHQGLETPILPIETFESKVRVYLSADQSISSATETKVELDTETYDSLGEFDPTTNYRFTAQKTGYYQVNTTVTYHPTGDGYIILRLKKTGTIVMEGLFYIDSVGGENALSMSDIIYLETGDYLELFAKNNYGLASNVRGGSETTFMSINKISG